MEECASIDPKNVNEKSQIPVFCYDGRRNLDGLVIGNGAVLFLGALSLYRCDVWAIDCEGSSGVVRSYRAVAYESCFE